MHATASLFDALPPHPARVAIDEEAWLLRAWAHADAAQWIDAVQRVLQQAPWRTMRTPGGAAMSVAMSNCGAWGWISDAAGYRYSRIDPITGKPWPAMPAWLQTQATAAAAAAGYTGYRPDACLLNCYTPGAKMALHRDDNEMDWNAPIVSVSLGLHCTFVWGGAERSSPVRRWALEHGDVLVWGGASRLHYHGVLPLRPGHHTLLGAQRWNLTFRMAQTSYPIAQQPHWCP